MLFSTLLPIYERHHHYDTNIFLSHKDTYMGGGKGEHILKVVLKMNMYFWNIGQKLAEENVKDYFSSSVIWTSRNVLKRKEQLSPIFGHIYDGN